MMKLVFRCLLIAAFAATSGAAFAQPAQTGTIQGEVKDASGAFMPGVTMTLTSEDRGFVRSTVTDENGRYVFPAVPAGSYTVEAVLQGFKTDRSTDNLVQAERTTAVSFALEIGALTEAVQVIGETPIVDPTTVTQTTRLTRAEFDKLPIGRSYQALMTAAPGVVGTGNANSAGSISSSNLFVVDAVDTTDPTTGTFGTNINFESIQEMSVLTTAAGAEYGRAQGAIVSVVTKSGTNRFEGSAKYIFLNDEWDAQNTTVNEITGASLERVKFDQVNPVYSFAGGGPIWKNRAFFFGTWELQENTTPQRQTAGQIPEDFQQTTESRFSNIRGTVQLREGHTAWVKYHQSPTDGIVRNDYWGVTVTGDRAALTAQNQTNESYAAQWSGVIRPNWAMEAAFSSFKILIDVTTFEDGILNNAPIFNLADSKSYNGATFDGFVERPRQQFNLASNWFLTLGRARPQREGRLRFPESGVARRSSTSRTGSCTSSTTTSRRRRRRCSVPTRAGATTTRGRRFRPARSMRSSRATSSKSAAGCRSRPASVSKRRPATATSATRRSMPPCLRRDCPAPMTCRGTARRSSPAATAATTRASSRASPMRSRRWRSRPTTTTSTGTAAPSCSRTASRSAARASSRTSISSPRTWTKRPSGSSVRSDARWAWVCATFTRCGATSSTTSGRSTRTTRSTVRSSTTMRPNGSYNGIQFTGERRFSNNWSAATSYTYSRTEGNHFNDNFTTLGDYLDTNCRTTVDLTVGNNGVIPCAEVQNGANKSGLPTYDRPHNFKMLGTYVRPIGPVVLNVGAVSELVSKFRYEKTRTVNVLLPGTLTNQGSTATYFYNERGADPVDGMEWYLDTRR